MAVNISRDNTVFHSEDGIVTDRHSQIIAISKKLFEPVRLSRTVVMVISSRVTCNNAALHRERAIFTDNAHRSGARPCAVILLKIIDVTNIPGNHSTKHDNGSVADIYTAASCKRSGFHIERAAL